MLKPSSKSIKIVDTTVTPFVVAYDGTSWDQPYSDAAPAAIGDLAVHLAGDDLHLTWSAITENIISQPIVVDHYTVYRGTNPEFSPSPGDSVGITSGTSYDDPAPGLKNPGTNHYYVVKAVDGAGRKSANSNRVGEFDRILIETK